jgi:hypothetical protein
MFTVNDSQKLFKIDSINKMDQFKFMNADYAVLQKSSYIKFFKFLIKKLNNVIM